MTRKFFLGVLLPALFLFVSLASILPANAQTPDLGISYPAASGLTSTDVRVVVAQLVRVALGVLGILAVVIVVYAGFTWMTAGGNEERIGVAKKWLTAGVIGMVLIFSAFSIATYVEISLVNVSNTAGNNIPVAP